MRYPILGILIRNYLMNTDFAIPKGCMLLWGGLFFLTACASNDLGLGVTDEKPMAEHIHNHTLPTVDTSTLGPAKTNLEAKAPDILDDGSWERLKQTDITSRSMALSASSKVARQLVSDYLQSGEKRPGGHCLAVSKSRILNAYEEVMGIRYMRIYPKTYGHVIIRRARYSIICMPLLLEGTRVGGPCQKVQG